MKHSKTFLLILIITVLALAVSACADGTNGSGGGNTPSYIGKRVSANIFSVDGENVVFTILPSGVNISIRTIVGTAETVSSVTGGITYETKEYLGTIGGTGNNLSFIAAYNVEVTVAPELLAGFAVGDSVYVTFDEEGNVTKIEEREVSSADKDKDKGDKKEENSKDEKDEKNEKQ